MGDTPYGRIWRNIFGKAWQQRYLNASINSPETIDRMVTRIEELEGASPRKYVSSTRKIENEFSSFLKENNTSLDFMVPFMIDDGTLNEEQGAGVLASVMVLMLHEKRRQKYDGPGALVNILAVGRDYRKELEYVKSYESMAGLGLFDIARYNRIIDRNFRKVMEMAGELKKFYGASPRTNAERMRGLHEKYKSIFESEGADAEALFRAMITYKTKDESYTIMSPSEAIPIIAAEKTRKKQDRRLRRFGFLGKLLNIALSPYDSYSSWWDANSMTTIYWFDNPQMRLGQVKSIFSEKFNVRFDDSRMQDEQPASEMPEEPVECQESPDEGIRFIRDPGIINLKEWRKKHEEDNSSST